MRPLGTPAELERRRRLAIARHDEGYPTDEIAEFLGVTPRSVWRWIAAHRRNRRTGLDARPTPGRPPKLTRAQEKIVARWLAEPPTTFGYRTDLWTAGRLADLVREQFGASFCPNYLCDWLRRRGYTPQKPLRVPRERDPEAIAGWRAAGWERIKKVSAGGTPS